MKTSLKMSPDFGTGLGKLVVKTKQEPAVQKVDPFEVGQHKPDGMVGPQVFSCRQKWPEKAGWYLTLWVRNTDQAPLPEAMTDASFVRYIDPAHGASMSVPSWDANLRHVIGRVEGGGDYSITECAHGKLDSLYWTDAPLPDWFIKMLDNQKASL